MSFEKAGRGCCALLLLAAAGSAAAEPGYALYGKPRYEQGYTHFDYVNPDAPKGGTVVLSHVAQASSFDKLNPFSLRGRPAPGLNELVFETLAEYSLDEVTTQYGVLAEDIEVAPDLRSVTFRLHPQARFSNGDAVTAADVKYSFDTLSGDKAAPNFQSFFSEIRQAVVIDRLGVRFDFVRAGRDLPFIAGALPVFSPKWGDNPDGSRTGFDELRKEPPVASGPYRVERINDGKGITYRRNPDYWGNQVPARRGFYNFDRVVYKLYKDTELQIEAFRAGDFDVITDMRARSWCCRYTGKRFADGTLVKSIFPHHNPPSMNGTVFNLRRERFADIRVRKALNLVYDFEWINDKIFHGDYKRVNSYFVNTELAASGLPTPEELAVLEPYRAQLDPAVFGPVPQQPSSYAPSSFRQNLQQALELMAQAGWHYRDGFLRNDKGEIFEMEMAFGERLPTPFTEAYVRNLTLLGVKIKRRINDPAAARKRLQEFDYDNTSLALREARIPGSELLRNFSSEGADTPGSENLIGVKSPAVDALLQRLLDASSEAELVATARALDRVLLHGYYVVPFRYNFEHRVAYNSRLGHPQTLPDYYEPIGWALSTWWDQQASAPAQAAKAKPAAAGGRNAAAGP